MESPRGRREGIYIYVPQAMSQTIHLQKALICSCVPVTFGAEFISLSFQSPNVLGLLRLKKLRGGRPRALNKAHNTRVPGLR